VLQAAVVAIGATHGLGQRGRNQAKFAGGLQQGYVAAVAGQLRVPAGVAEHQILDDEFDVDQPAVVMFQVEQFALARVGIDHFLPHRQYFALEFGEVAGLAQDLDADFLESRADIAVAGGEARPGERLMLPHPGSLELILAEGVKRADEQAGIAVGTQPQVGLEQQAGRRLAGKPGVEPRGEARIVFRSKQIRIVVEENQVEIGGIAEFLAAEFSIADDGETRRLDVTLVQLAPGELEGQFEHDIGQVGEVVGELFQRQQAGDVLCQQPEYLGVMGFAQHVHLPFGVWLGLFER